MDTLINYTYFKILLKLQMPKDEDQWAYCGPLGVGVTMAYFL